MPRRSRLEHDAPRVAAADRFSVARAKWISSGHFHIGDVLARTAGSGVSFIGNAASGAVLPVRAIPGSRNAGVNIVVTSLDGTTIGHSSGGVAIGTEPVVAPRRSNVLPLDLSSG
jgi:hypothetical protein